MDEQPLEKVELDYAFLAEYARVEGNSLTAVGASFTVMEGRALPFTTTVYVAGRLRAPQDADPFEVTVMAGQADGDAPSTAMYTTFNPQDGAHPYRDRVGMTFAVGIPLEITSEGLFQVIIGVDGQRVRTLRFEVAAPDTTAV